MFTFFRRGVSEFATHLPYFLAWWLTWQLADWVWGMLRAAVTFAAN